MKKGIAFSPIVRSIFALLLSYCLYSPIIGQNVQKYTGKVIDRDQVAVPGASIAIKGTPNGTVTDDNGTFTLNANKGDVIVLNSIGMKTIEQVLGNNTDLSFMMDADNSLNEVVVTGLYIKKETKKLGYSLQEVKGEDLVKAREANPISALVGKVAGVNVGVNQEMLGKQAVTFRGSPITLYVVDGMPITTDTWNISPDDIESYTILKGLAASAIYGSRAKDGAIIITTKKGVKNSKGFTIEYNSSIQMNKGFIALPRTQDLYGGGDYNQYSFGDGKGGGINDGDYDVWGPKFEGQLIAQYDSPIDPATGKRIPTPYIARGTDNLKRFIQAGVLSTNSLSFSTASDKASIRMGITNTSQKGIVPNTKLNIINYNINSSYDLSSKFKLEGNLNYNRQFTPNTPDVVYGPNSIIYNISVWTGADWDVKAPDIVNYWQPGKEGVQSNFAEYKRYHNPYFSSYEWLRGHYKNDVNGGVSLTYKASEKLNAIVRANMSNYDLLRNEKMPYSAHPYGREGNRGDYREDRRSLFDNNVEALINYSTKLGAGFALDAHIGGNVRNLTYNSSYTTTDYLNVPGLYTFSNSLNAIQAANYGSNMAVLSGYYSADIDYDKYLTITATGRVDKHSTLLKNNNTYFYPSVSVATVLSDYINLPRAISFLKLRAAYATAKSPDISDNIGPAAYPIGYGSPYVSVYGGPAYTILDPAYSITKVYNNLTGAYAPGNKLDPNIKSSVNSSAEVGIDARLFGNRIGLGATYFSNIIGPRITTLQVSEASGLTGNISNAIKTKKTGAEIMFTAIPVQTQNFTWKTYINWSTFKEVYSDLPEANSSYQFKQGDRVDKIYAGVTAKTPDGQVINDASGYPVYLPKAQYIGNSDPDFAWGVNNKLNYGSFGLSFQFDGVVGGKVQDRVLRKTIEGGRALETIEGKVGEARDYEFHHFMDKGYTGIYVGEGVQLADGSPKIAYDPTTGVITNASALKFVPNASKIGSIQDYVSSFFNDAEHTSVNKTFAKLREVILSYSLPVSLLGNQKVVNKVSLSLVGRNLLYFFPKRFKDMDVDQYSGRDYNGGNSREYDLQTPTTRSYGVNLNVVF